MATLSPLMARTQRCSHWVSCGHTLPQTAGRALASLRMRKACSISPSAICSMKAGMSMRTGQPSTQGLLRQFRQRAASSMAISRV